MRLILPTAFTSSLLLALAAADSPSEPLLDLPVPVKTSIQREATGHHVAAIERAEREGRLVYYVRIAQEGIDKRLTIAADGQVLEVLEFPTVNRLISDSKKAGGEAWDKTKDLAGRAWEATSDTVQHAIKTFQSSELSLNQVPQVPRQTLEREAAGDRLSAVQVTIDGPTTRYQATITRADHTSRTLVVDDQGRVLSPP